MVHGTKIVYSPQYDIDVSGIDHQHPFDLMKYGKAWEELNRTCGPQLRGCWIDPGVKVGPKDLVRVHPPTYLAKLRKPDYVAQALEVPMLAHMSMDWMDDQILRPMRYATQGTLVAAREALDGYAVVNLSGGVAITTRAGTGGKGSVCTATSPSPCIAFGRSARCHQTMKSW